jgi:hypothetical protein
MRTYFLHSYNASLSLREDRGMSDQPLVTRPNALFIGGAWVPPSTDDVIEVVSPHTEETDATVTAPATAAS